MSHVHLPSGEAGMLETIRLRDVQELASDILTSLRSAERAQVASQGLHQTRQLKPGWQEALLPQMKVQGIAAFFLGTHVPVGDARDARQRLQDMTNRIPDITRMRADVLGILADCEHIHERPASEHPELLRTAWNTLREIQDLHRAASRARHATLNEFLQ